MRKVDAATYIAVVDQLNRLVSAVSVSVPWSRVECVSPELWRRLAQRSPTHVSLVGQAPFVVDDYLFA